MTVPDTWQRQAEMLVNRIGKRRRQLRGWLRQEGIACYRLYDRDIPEIPLAVDWYEGRLHVSVYERARGEQGDLGPWLDAMTEALRRALQLGTDSVYAKRRRAEEGGTQYRTSGSLDELIPISEGGLTFLVNLTDYVDTGLFLDHRKTRGMVREMSRRKQVLNLFGYTGAFSVYAAAGGADTVTTVDLSNTYLEWAKRNMVVNGFQGERYRFIRDDIVGALSERRMSGVYDLIVLDPPTVSKSKRMARAFDVQRDHPLLLSALMDHLAPEGVLIFSTNYKRFKLEVGRDDIASEEISHRTCPRDFAARPLHRCWRMTHR